MSCPHLSRVDAHFALRGAVEDERALRAHLPECEECRGRYQWKRLLATVTPWAPSTKERLGVALGLVTAPSARGAAFRVAATAFALVAVAVVATRFGPDDGFQARGEGGPSGELATPQLVLHQRSGEGWAPVSTSLQAKAPVALSYRGAAAYRHLMVWARAGTETYWYAPRWADAAQNPVSIAVGPQGSGELPEAVTHPLPVGPVRFEALFSREPHSVEEIEALLSAGGRVGVPDGVVNSVDVVVTEGEASP